MAEVSHSKIKTARRCWKMFDYRYRQRIKKKAPPLPLIRGSMLGEMLNARALGTDAERILKKYEKEYGKLFREEKEMYGDIIGDVRAIFRNYDNHYENEKLEYIGIEVEVRVPLTPEIEFIGFIDKVVKDKNRQIWNMDHKSHKSIPSEDNRYADLQQLFYVWAYNKTVKPREQMSGIIWDYLRTKPPTIPESLKAGGLTKRKDLDSTYEVYLTEIKRLKLDPKDYAEPLERLKKGPNQFFQRVKLPESNGSMVTTVVNDLIDTAKSIQGNTLTTRNMTWDCPQCEFFELCQTELRGYDSSFIRKTKYVKREDSEDVRKAKKLK